MINHHCGDATFSGVPATGLVKSFTAQQIYLTGISCAWVYEGFSSASIFFLVYVNGRFVQRLPGTELAANVMALSYDTQDVQVIPWRRNMPIPEDIYGAALSFRAHLEWSRIADPSIASYNIYYADSEAGTYELLSDSTQARLQTGFFEMGAAGTMEVSGVYDLQNGHKNTRFTVTVTDAATGMAEVTNDLDATTLPIVFYIGTAVVLSGGIIVTITGEVEDGDTASFLVGVPCYFDTPVLDSGTYWFKVAPVDAAGNESALSPAIPVTINQPISPVSEFKLSYDEATDEVKATCIQSGSPTATKVFFYSNYDPSRNVFMPGILFEIAQVEVAALSGAVDINGDPVVVSAVILDGTTAPDGILQVSARAGTALNSHDGTVALKAFSLPYVPPDLPTPFLVEATPTAGGGAVLTWLTRKPVPSSDPDTPGSWRITGLAAPLVENPPALDENGFMRYTVELTQSDIGADGTYTAVVAAQSVSGLYWGVAGEVTFVTDSVSPASISGITGTAF